MLIKHQYDTQEDVPAEYADLYSEKGGKWELTGVTGVKTVEDVARIETSLRKERDAHKATRTKLGEWSDMDRDDVLAKLDRIAELEAAAGGKLDEKALGEIVEKRLAGKLATETAPLKRDLDKLRKEHEKLVAERETLLTEKRTRSLQDSIRPLLAKANVLPEHHEDAFMFAERHLQVTEDGKFVTRDGVGVTPGLDVTGWLDEFLPRKPGWIPGSQGGGARGSGTSGINGVNPWAKDTWNFTEQGRYVNQHGSEKAKRLAEAAGTSLGGPKPTK